MKDFRHIILSFPNFGIENSFASRITQDHLEDAAIDISLQHNPDEPLDDRRYQRCDYLWVTLNRVPLPGCESVDDVYVLGTIYPAFLKDVTPENARRSWRKKSKNTKTVAVCVFSAHNSDPYSTCSMRANYVNKFVSFQHFGHATKGGVQGTSKFHEYGGVFRTMKHVYKALSDIYPNL